MRTGKNQQKRQSERLAVAGDVLCDVGGSVSTDALCDLSPHGCRLQSAAGNLSAGTAIALTLIDDIEIRGVVRWASDEHAGIEFLEPLSEAAVRYLALPEADQTPAFVPHDGFGRRLPPLGRLGDIS